jgi:hypothetical protein
MLKHLFTIIATILVVSSALKAQLHDLVYGVYGPGLVTVTGDCYTDSNWGDLTFVPGTTVQFNGRFQILIVGGTALYANGTEAAPILFTSPPGNPTAGYWKALIVGGNSPACNITLYNCEISYGGESEGTSGAASGVIQCNTYSNAYISKCYIHDIAGAGVCFCPHGAAPTPPSDLQVDSCNFENCDIGVKVVNGDVYTNYVTVKRNWVENCSIGMKLWAQEWDNNIVNNIIRASTDYGVYAFSWPPSGSRIGHFWNNVIDGDGVSLDGIYTEDRIWYQGIVNNLIMNNTGYGIYNESEGDAIDVYNCCFYANQSGSTNWAGHLWDCIEDQDPRLVSAYGDDGFYHLLWDSPCLGTGDDELSNSNPAISCSMP